MSKRSPENLSETEFEVVYNRYWRKLYCQAYNYFRDKTTAQELVQDVFIKLWFKRGQLSQVDDLGAYLFTCMKNRIYDKFDSIACQEKLKKNSLQSFNEEIHPVEEAIGYEETLTLINQELDKLPIKTRTIFRLSKFERYTNDEISSQMQLSSKAVEYHITQALKRLRIKLSHLVTFVASFFMLY